MNLAMDRAGIAAGIVFVAPGGKILLLRRSATEENFPGHWSLPGGKADDGETADQAARREALEEIGDHPNGKRELVEKRTTPTGMQFYTFKQSVGDEFVPKLNGEHSDYAWVSRDDLPSPIHPVVKDVLTNKMAQDAVRKRDRIALDRASVRTTDSDGHMHVASSIISAAAVNEYLGAEIPDFEALGLKPDVRYKLYRDPAELEKGAPSLHGKPLLIIHRPQSADDHDREVVVGSVSNPVWDDPKLKGELAIWDGEAIDGINSGEQRSLSAGYQYVPVMTPGTTPDGEAFDGVMTKIEFNHVALVTEPRVAGAMVGDSAITNIKETFEMSKVLLTRMGSVARGALMVALKPKLAQDAKIDISPLLVNLTGKNFKAKKPSIVAGLKKLTTGKLATDASIDDVIKLVDALEDNEVMEGADTDPDSGEEVDPDASMDAEGGGLRDFLKGKLGEDDYMKACDMLKPGGATDEDDEEAKKKKKDEDDKNLAGDVEEAVKEKTKDMVTKKAMDEAIKKAVTDATTSVTKNATETLEAREAVHPFVGKLPLALDSAVGVYQSALGVLGVEDADKINDLGALKAVLKAQTVPGTTTMKPKPAMDAAAAKSYDERFPGAAKIKISA
jgi:8-oxo-dGTP pyrophosphatase MutT (NUDIX family)